jgi:hypothetical protein
METVLKMQVLSLDGKYVVDVLLGDARNLKAGPRIFSAFPNHTWTLKTTTINLSR